jgi:lipopolysaccharide/colanic/teichoic acid biosynthesis glycosyltransferase
VQLDSTYVREWSFTGDMVILLKTVKVVALRSGSR